MPSSHVDGETFHSHPQPDSYDTTNGCIRKRVSKACDRCRLKKSKCDGAHPCSRCKIDNAICVFGERRNSHNKTYPKGYIETLEKQQSQLVSGLQKMYRKLLEAGAWSSSELDEYNNYPLTHDILAALDLLEVKQDGRDEMEKFEDDHQKLQSRLYSESASLVDPCRSVSSDPEHNFDTNLSPRSLTLSNPQGLCQEKFGWNISLSPLSQSPAPKSQQYFAQPIPSSQYTSPVTNDPQLYQAEWAIPCVSVATQTSKAQSAAQQPKTLDFSSHETSMNQGTLSLSSLDIDARLDMCNIFSNIQSMQDFGFPAYEIVR